MNRPFRMLFVQHFWRKLGYRDCGGLTLPFPGHEQPLELILGKTLEEIP